MVRRYASCKRGDVGRVTHQVPGRCIAVGSDGETHMVRCSPSVM